VSDLHSHPTAAELLDATIEFLTDTITPAVPVEQAFHLRVALNALAMVRRELESTGDDAGLTGDDVAHRSRLAAIGYANDAALAAALRAGEVPADQLSQVRASLLADAEARLRVVNPRFAADYDDVPRS